ncbi:RING finger protein 227 [Pempheris klunzingeri]|uniref:RING finger protein 227 n=1 Tax=Pempheris klunzingeri TaxID=3127111 RepID=UPI003980B4C6
MYSDLECGICYRVYNAGRRCPRELHCKHSFCEGCLLTLSRPPGRDEGRLGADRLIVCPLCRHTTSISGEGAVRSQLMVDECALERLLAAGVLDREEDPEDEDVCDDTERPTPPESPAEESDSFSASGFGRHRGRWRKVWRKICGKRRRENLMTNEDLRSLALMSCYMF